MIPAQISRYLAIHEYQAKELLRNFGISTLPGDVAQTPTEAAAVAQKLIDDGASKVVVKAQIHAGGRGKGHFIGGMKGGVKLCDTPAEAAHFAENMLGHTLVTNQTGPQGKEVFTVYLEGGAEIQRELYLSIIMDRGSNGPVIVASQEGGVDIESVAAEEPEKILKFPIDIDAGISHDKAVEIAVGLGFVDTTAINQVAKQITRLYNCFIETDATQIEINPLADSNNEALVLDAKFNFDDNAEFRQEQIFALRDKTEEDEKELIASKFDFNWVTLDGNISMLVNGAGLAMATCDCLDLYGGRPANFLDTSGAVSIEKATEAFKLIVSDKRSECILVNIFGGIVHCPTVAQAIIAACKAVDLDRPLVIRLEGNEADVANKLIIDSGLEAIVAHNLADACQKAVRAAKEFRERKHHN